MSGRTKEAARRALREARANSDQGLLFDADNLEVGEYLDRWLADSVSDTVKATTFERYEQITRLHLKPALGRLKLKALTPAHVRGIFGPHGTLHPHHAPQGSQAGGGTA